MEFLTIGSLKNPSCLGSHRGMVTGDLMQIPGLVWKIGGERASCVLLRIMLNIFGSFGPLLFGQKKHPNPGFHHFHVQPVGGGCVPWQ